MLMSMNRDAARQFRRPGVEPPPSPRRFSTRWHGRLILILLGVILLTLAFAPVDQFYLAWVGLVPFFLVLSGTRSQGSAFFWGWVAGTLFFIANMWWMVYVTGPGMVALMAILGLYWGAAGFLIRGAGLLRTENGKEKMENVAGTDQSPAASSHFPFSIFHFPFFQILLIAAVWVAVGEWFRGTWPWNGLPWLYLGHTQSLALWLCQIADITGVAGLSFLIAMTNAWITLWLLNRLGLRGLVRSGLVILALIALVIAYGIFRFSTETLTPGPTVLVVQPNYPQSNTGAKGATPEEILDFHLRTTQEALAQNKNVDLIVWSETMMPPLNAYARQFLRGSAYGNTSERANRDIANLAFDSHAAVLTGGAYIGAFAHTDDEWLPQDTRNVAYFYNRNGVFSDLQYDKIHLVPFGEFIPFKESLPPLYRLMIRLGPPDMESYQLTAGNENELTVFPLSQTRGGPPWRFVTPICFEDIDADLCARMFRPDADNPTRKRADFLVNITNDGWFKANENAQHLQAAIFRDIENRVPTARAVNTGISGFIDPLGRTHDLLPARTQGAAVQSLMLDPRVTFFTRHGQLFAWLCAAVTVLIAAASLFRWFLDRQKPSV
jgi:apolipoprotein N-acyltransferase